MDTFVCLGIDMSIGFRLEFRKADTEPLFEFDNVINCWLEIIVQEANCGFHFHFASKCQQQISKTKDLRKESRVSFGSDLFLRDYDYKKKHVKTVEQTLY